MRVNRIFLAFVALILSAGGAYIYACHSPSFNVTEISVWGNHKISTDEVRDRLRPYLDRNILGLDSESIEEELREDVRLKQVTVRRRYPGSLVVELEEKTSVLWISLPDGRSELGSTGFCGLSIDQEIIPLDQRDLSDDLPMVSGITIRSGETERGGMPEPYHKWRHIEAQKALSLYRSLTAIDSSFPNLLSEINLADISNPVLYLLPNVKVMMGEGDLERKWKRVRTVLSGARDSRSFSCLDLRFDDQVLLTRSSSGKSMVRAGRTAKPSEGK